MGIRVFSGEDRVRAQAEILKELGEGYEVFEGTEQIIAQGANLCFFIVAGIASTVYNIKSKKIVWKTTLILSGAGIAFSLLGAWIAGIINPDILRKIFGGMLIIGGFSSLISAFSKKKQKQSI